MLIVNRDSIAIKYFWLFCGSGIGFPLSSFASTNIGDISFESSYSEAAHIVAPSTDAQKSLLLSVSSVKLGWRREIAVKSNLFTLRQELSYRGRILRYDDPLNNISRSDKLENLHSIAYRLFQTFSLGNNRWLTTTQHVGINSDLKADITSSDFRIEGGIIFSKMLTLDNKISAGIIYTAVLGEPKFSPFIGYYNKIDKIKIDINYPLNGSISLVIPPRAEIGLALKTYGNLYQINQSNTQINRLSYSAITVSTFSVIQWNEKVKMEFNIGWNIRNRFESFSGKTSVGLLDLENGVFVMFTMIGTQ